MNNNQKFAIALLKRISDLVTELDEDYGYELLAIAENHCKIVIYPTTEILKDDDFITHTLRCPKQIRRALVELIKARNLISIG
tara:strand:- start:68 stop:316 length:249 start_codon:yes stop_codon:yes gene_type:complete